MSGSTSSAMHPPLRHVVAAILLGVLGGFGVLVPLLVLSFRAMGVLSAGHGPAGIGSDFLSHLAEAVLSVPAVCTAAAVAAVGLYRSARWGRRLALAVGVLLAAGPAVGAASPLLPAIPFVRYDSDDVDLVTLALHHLFTSGRGLELHVLGLAAAGAVVLWCLLSGSRSAQPQIDDGAPEVAPTARRPRLAIVLLVLLAALSSGPYLAWVAAGLRASPTTEESHAAAISTGIMMASSASVGLAAGAVEAPVLLSGGPALVPGWDFGAGILIAIPSALAAILSVLAARAIASRAPAGPYLAPVAAAISGAWSAIWLFVLGLGASSPSDGDAGGRVVVGVLLLLLALLAAGSFVAVTASVLRRRTWFRVRGSLAPSARHGGGRRAFAVVVTTGAVLLAPIGIGAATWTGAPRGPEDQLQASDVLFEDRAYRLAAPVEVEIADLAAVGQLSAWTEDLTIDAIDVFAFPEVPAERAIVVQLGALDDPRTHGLFVPSNDLSDGIPAELCRYVPLEDDEISVEPCGPPWEIRFGGVSYEQLGEPRDFPVELDDLASTGMSIEILAGAASPDPRIDLVARSIGQVPTSDAVALVIETRVVLYKVVGRYGPGELCRLAVPVVDPELIEKGGEDPMRIGLPGGCDFPSQVWFGDTMYGHERRDDELLLVPRSAIAAAGTAEVAQPELGPGHPFERQPFPPTVDPTAYAIAGVSTTDAIAFVIGDRVFVLRPEGGRLPLPTALCGYVVGAYALQLEAEGEGPVGCPTVAE